MHGADRTMCLINYIPPIVSAPYWRIKREKR
nr:MAG TPA: hypothetical protein [Caudoviricetes sp.]